MTAQQFMAEIAAQKAMAGRPLMERRRFDVLRRAWKVLPIDATSDEILSFCRRMERRP